MTQLICTVSYDEAELSRRRAWLSILARGKRGLSMKAMRSIFMALYRSKLTYGLLLKEPYSDKFEEIQRRAIRICAGALYSCPIELCYDVLDIPNIQQLFQIFSLRAAARIAEHQLDPLSADYFNWIEQHEGEHNHFTPYGLLQQAFLDIDERLINKVHEISGQLDVKIKHEQAMYIHEIIPVAGREKWKPKDYGNEIAVYSDSNGGFDPKSLKGSWVFSTQSQLPDW
jgi:hypothetical protein